MPQDPTTTPAPGFWASLARLFGGDGGPKADPATPAPVPVPSATTAADVPSFPAPRGRGQRASATPDIYGDAWDGPAPSGAPLLPVTPAPAAQTPDGSSARQRQLAPPPIIDRTPIVIGQNLSLTYLASAFRNCTNGLRYQFVDVLSELLEHDPHARGVVRQRVLNAITTKIEVLPAELADGDPDKERAKAIADQTRAIFRNIPRLSQSLGALAWGIITGVSGIETEWERTDMWRPRALHPIHSRRLNYSNPGSNALHVWDQGAVGPGFGYMGPTTGVYGLRMADYPGKFIIHAPQLSGEYPWRDGEGRFIASYMAIKRMVVRATAQDFERTVRPWVVGYFSRDEEKDTPVPAETKDIERLNQAVTSLGLGSLNSAVLPDACKIEVLRAASSMDAEKFVSWLDGQITRSVLGQDFTTQPGKAGARSASEVAERGTMRLARYDAACLADSLERDLVYWIVRLNWPGAEARLLPRLVLNVEEELTPKEMMELAKDATSIDMPVDQDWLAERTTIRILGKDDEDGRRTRALSPGKGPTPPNPDEPAPDDDPEGEGDDATRSAAGDRSPAAEKKPALRAEPEPLDEAAE